MGASEGSLGCRQWCVQILRLGFSSVMSALDSLDLLCLKLLLESHIRKLVLDSHIRKKYKGGKDKLLKCYLTITPDVSDDAFLSLPVDSDLALPLVATES